MRLLTKLRALCGKVVRARARRVHNEFLSATVDCRGTQHEVLRQLLALNAGSRFSREHGLDDVSTVAEFRQRLPVADFEYFRPYVDQLKQGDHAALLGPKNRLLMFALSSGTTSDAKFIPITERFLSDYRRGWQVWGIRVFDHFDGINTKNIVQLTSDYDRFRTPGGTPCGNISGLVSAMQNPLVRSMYKVPSAVNKIGDPDAKYYTAMRLSLVDEYIGLVMTANPSTLIQLARLADTKREELIRDIYDGTLTLETTIDDSVRRKLQFRIGRRHRARARQLEQIVERTGRLYPSDYWSNAEIVAVWTGGSAGAYLSSLRRYFGDVPIRDHGLSASEGRMTIPLEDGRSDGVLDVTTHFFEFIPEEEHGNENPTVLEAHELEEGRNYFILLTTSSGLYRYDICDVVRCIGFHETTPMLEFLHKGAHISNITGEKVSESQIVAAVRKCAERMQIHLEHFTVSPVWGEPPRYQLMAEESDLASPRLGDGLATGVDSRLQMLNCEYREKRMTGRLDAMKWVSLPPGTWAKFARQRQSKLGGSIEQYKHPCLIPDLNFSSQFISEFVAGTTGYSNK
jgi:hypothetical protein